MKHLLFYSGITENIGERLQYMLKKVAPSEDTEICRTIHSLAYNLLPLRTITDSQRIVHILIATTKQELLDLHSIRDLLSDMRIILIVPNRKEDTVALAHDLFPRYLSFLDEDLEKVGAVFNKMVTNSTASH